MVQAAKPNVIPLGTPLGPTAKAQTMNGSHLSQGLEWGFCIRWRARALVT